MKTKLYILTLLTLIIHVIMNSQTQTTRKDLMSFRTKMIEKQESMLTNNNAADVQKQVANMNAIASKIKAAAVNRQAVEKKVMLQEAAELQNSAVIEQIKVSEQSVKIKQQSYDLNNKTLAVLMRANQKDIDAVDRAENYRMDAEKVWKTAKALLSEAYAEKNEEARLGAIGNAEEKEMVALLKQNKAIDILTKSNAEVTFLSAVPVK